MQKNRRTQAERTSATRTTLIAVARDLFAERGFAGVSTEEIVQSAGLTRGALYHQFADKTELFAAVFEAVEADTIGRIGQRMASAAEVDPLSRMRAGVQAWLDLCQEPEIRRIALLEARAVLGWSRWREIGARYSLAIVQQAVAAAIDAGQIEQQPLAPLAHLLLGVVREGALYLATEADQGRAREEVGKAMEKVIDGFTRQADRSRPKPSRQK